MKWIAIITAGLLAALLLGACLGSLDSGRPARRTESMDIVSLGDGWISIPVSEGDIIEVTKGKTFVVWRAGR